MGLHRYRDLSHPTELAGIELHSGGRLLKIVSLEFQPNPSNLPPATPPQFDLRVFLREPPGNHSMERAKRIAFRFFAELGFDVAEIDEATEKRADLDVTDGLQQYVVEVKEKLDTGLQLSVLEESYPGSGRHITTEPHAPSNRVDGILKKARKQLSATPASHDALRLIFLLFRGPNADMFVRRSLYTFYGIQDVIPRAENRGGQNCVYFHNSFSFSSPNVDGLLLVENNDVQLCLNEFSRRCDMLRQSQLCSKMGAAVYDPATFDDDDGKVVLRSTVSRGNESDVLEELCRVTGVRYTTITLNRYSM